MLRVCVGPTSQKTVTHELMAACAKLAREHEGVRLHTHLAENAEDVEYTLKMHGYRFGDYIRYGRRRIGPGVCTRSAHSKACEAGARAAPAGVHRVGIQQ